MPSKLFGSKTAARPHLAQPGGGLSGEIYDLRSDTEEAFAELEAGGGYLFTEEFTDVAVADTDAIKLNIATSTSPVTYSGADLDGTVGGGEMVPPRSITVTGDASLDIDAATLTITGFIRNEEGNLVAQTDTISITDNLATTLTGTKPFSTVTSLAIDTGMAGTGGTFEFGFGAGIGLAKLIKSRGGVIAPLREIESGTGVVTTGTFTNPAGSPVTLYVPGTAPNDSEDYVVTYEVG